MEIIYLVVPGNEFGTDLDSGKVWYNEGEALLDYIEKSENEVFEVMTLYKIENGKIELLKCDYDG